MSKHQKSYHLDALEKHNNVHQHNNYVNSATETFQRVCRLSYRSAQRLVIQMLYDKDQLLHLSNILHNLHNSLQRCKRCNNIDVNDICSICIDNTRDENIICVVESMVHMLAIERSGCFSGKYHIIFDNIKRQIAIDTSAIDILLDRLHDMKIHEIIIGLDSSLNGEVITQYILDMLPHNIKVTRLAFGIPVGANIEYMDSDTLGIAINTRQEIIKK